MKLSDLVSSIDLLECKNPVDPEVTGLFHDSREVQPGGLFFALKGVNSDGHRFIPSAIDKGAVAVVLEEPAPLPNGIALIKVADARMAMAQMAAKYYGDPTADLPLVGITGTNGKTTTTYLLEAIFAAAGIPAAILGTISYRFGNTSLQASHTTPESTELQAALRKLAQAGARAFVMEVSSHALEQKRVDGCHFDVGIFSNLTRDHLDYHGSMAAYFNAKQRLFSELLLPDILKPLRRAAVNIDDPSGAEIAARSAAPVITFGINREAAIHPIEYSLLVSGIIGSIHTPKGDFSFTSHLLGRFNLSNILAAVAAGIALDLPLEAIREALGQLIKVPGRLERVESGCGVNCLVDYAHTGDALENVLTTLKEIATARIITVFGCGGDRDRGKRPVMGKIAAELSDLAIITSDNPRSEEPFSILEEIKNGISPPFLHMFSEDELACGFVANGQVVVENRREAIRLAVRLAEAEDIILLAGKGHEDYQIIGSTRHHFDDREEAAKAFAERCG